MPGSNGGWGRPHQKVDLPKLGSWESRRRPQRDPVRPQDGALFLMGGGASAPPGSLLNYDDRECCSMRRTIQRASTSCRGASRSSPLALAAIWAPAPVRSQDFPRSRSAPRPSSLAGRRRPFCPVRTDVRPHGCPVPAAWGWRPLWASLLLFLVAWQVMIAAMMLHRACR